MRAKGESCIERNSIALGECLEWMEGVDDASVDLILCDLPYGITGCKWDSAIPLGRLWEQYRRIRKERAPVVLTAAEPFTSALVTSNLREFRYCWYWVKDRPTGFPFAKVQPMRNVEDVCVFYTKAPTYNPQGLVRLEEPRTRSRRTVTPVYRPDGLTGKEWVQEYTGYPRQVLQVGVERGLHPTQKPVALFEYLVRTYTDEGALVMDNCMGSGTTAIACIRSGRDFIGCEMDPGYHAIAQQRIADELGRWAHGDAGCAQGVRQQGMEARARTGAREG